MHRMRRILGLLLTCTLALLLPACSRSGTTAPPVEPTKYPVSYALDLEFAHVDGKPLKLDIWRPDPAPVVAEKVLAFFDKHLKQKD